MQTIKLQEKELPIKFTYSALMELEKNLKKTFSEIANELSSGNMTIMVMIAYVGFKTAARIEKKEFNLSVEEVGDMLTSDTLVLVTEAFGEAFAPSEKSEGDQDTESKKK